MGLLTVEDRYPWVPQLKSKSWRFLNRQHQQQNDVARALVDQQDLCVDSLAVLEWSSSHLGNFEKKKIKIGFFFQYLAHWGKNPRFIQKFKISKSHFQKHIF